MPFQGPLPAPALTCAITGLLWLWTQTVAELALLSAVLWLAVRRDRHALLNPQQRGASILWSGSATLSLAVLALAAQVLIVVYPFFLLTV
jgi:hypothetical protein